jgi:hypothetical protein
VACERDGLVGQAAVTADAGRRLPAASRGAASDVVAVLSAGLMLALTAAAVAVAVMVAAGQTSFANLWGTVVLALGCAAVGCVGVDRPTRVTRLRESLAQWVRHYGTGYVISSEGLSAAVPLVRARPVRSPAARARAAG